MSKSNFGIQIKVYLGKTKRIKAMLIPLKLRTHMPNACLMTTMPLLPSFTSRVQLGIDRVRLAVFLG